MSSSKSKPTKSGVSKPKTPKSAPAKLTESMMDDSDYDEVEHTKKKRSRASYSSPRKLVRWNPDMDQLTLLCVEAACTTAGIQIPWDKVATLVKAGLTGEAVKQHLTKVRKFRDLEGHALPGQLSLGIGGGSSTSRKKATAEQRKKANNLLWTGAKEADKMTQGVIAPDSGYSTASGSEQKTPSRSRAAPKKKISASSGVSKSRGIGGLSARQTKASGNRGRVQQQLKEEDYAFDNEPPTEKQRAMRLRTTDEVDYNEHLDSDDEVSKAKQDDDDSDFYQDESRDDLGMIAPQKGFDVTKGRSILKGLPDPPPQAEFTVQYTAQSQRSIPSPNYGAGSGSTMAVDEDHEDAAPAPQEAPANYDSTMYGGNNIDFSYQTGSQANNTQQHGPPQMVSVTNMAYARRAEEQAGQIGHWNSVTPNSPNMRPYGNGADQFSDPFYTPSDANVQSQASQYGQRSQSGQYNYGQNSQHLQQYDGSNSSARQYSNYPSYGQQDNQYSNLQGVQHAGQTELSLAATPAVPNNLGTPLRQFPKRVQKTSGRATPQRSTPQRSTPHRSTPGSRDRKRGLDQVVAAMQESGYTQNARNSVQSPASSVRNSVARQDSYDNNMSGNTTGMAGHPIDNSQTSQTSYPQALTEPLAVGQNMPDFFAQQDIVNLANTYAGDVDLSSQSTLSRNNSFRQAEYARTTSPADYHNQDSGYSFNGWMNAQAQPNAHGMYAHLNTNASTAPYFNGFGFDDSFNSSVNQSASQEFELPSSATGQGPVDEPAMEMDDMFDSQAYEREDPNDVVFTEYD